ncbi:hypothetical protein [Pedobacter hiemivivus]|uniref:Uncharacterized protein n=1 Tax=Pedobacter hiemivivus TaxID=2530454 RepID=A0A4R0NIP1_9SPHI|nr:hypothetical protein [Pedobacter hiemivivus]TCC99667.1 hypothetical protein EZ444_03070 [Pedobacter hiemivivus]
MYYNKLLTALFLIVTMNSCAQEKGKQNKKVMEKEIVEFQSRMYDKIKKFDKRPLYSLQVNKNNCRGLVLCNDIPHWLTFYENYGESMSLYLNNYIPKSGTQMIIVQVFPKEGEEYIAANADLDLKVWYAADKDEGVDAHRVLASAELPEDIGDRKLKYFEIKIPFKARVPFDFSKDLENAQALKNIADIEQKVVKKYQQLKELLVKGDGLSFAKEFEYSDLKSCTYLYANKAELIAVDKRDNADINRARLDVKNRRVHPIANYEMVFFAGGKLVLLRTAKGKKDMLRLEYDTEAGTDGDEKPAILYLPAGSTELKVW